MSADGSTAPQETAEYTNKGKGKQVEQDHDMMDAEDDESEESGAEEHVEEEEEDNLEEIDTSNILYSSGRTRGKQIDWAEAEQKSRDAGDDIDDEDDEDDDEDFVDPEDEDGMKD